jgi:hypothetical protein
MLSLSPELIDPPREFTLFPFWFWNDDLDRVEIVRQMKDFQAHGVYGFVIHPRVGLPRSTGWMSDQMLAFIRFAVEEAAKLGMLVMLYDEGMYPSGSSSGQVVASNPAFQCRCLARIFLAPGEGLHLPAGQNLVTTFFHEDGSTTAIIDRPVDAFIRGLHYIGDGPEEDEPAAADILNPRAVDCFLHLVYDRYAEVLWDHFGKTIQGIFTDEPMLLGRCREKGVVPGTTGIVERVSAMLGYDFTPHLLSLWGDCEPDSGRHREDYERAITQCLEESYYRPLSDWCHRQGIALIGHPARPDAIGLMRHFDIPGQDLVWRWVLPGEKSALEGPESTQAKCSSSAMIHLGRERNSNECFGAYGHSFTWREMKWLVDWCFVRGVNLLYPHAFYYSIRGPRKDERPPDVGPNSPWWGEYADFAGYCRRMAWINTGGQHICQVAVLGESDHLSWGAAKACFQHQRDFNYLEFRHLWQDALTTDAGVTIRGMHYPVVILDGFDRFPLEAGEALALLAKHGRLILWNSRPIGLANSGALVPASEAELAAMLDRLAPPDLFIDGPQPDLRVRHVLKEGLHYVILANEGLETIRPQIVIPESGPKLLFDPYSGKTEPLPDPAAVTLDPYTLKIILWRAQ